MKMLVWALAAAAFASSASAQDVTLQGGWLQLAPGSPTVEQDYPAGALDSAVDGQVWLSCTGKKDRTLDCVVTEEEPKGAGFGAAALNVARGFTLSEAGAAALKGKSAAVPISFKAARSARARL